MFRIMMVLLSLVSLSASAEKKARIAPLSDKSELLYEWNFDGGAFGCQLANGRYFSLTVEGEKATVLLHAFEWSVDSQEWVPFTNQIEIGYESVFVEEIKTAGTPQLRVFANARGLKGAQALDLRVGRDGSGSMTYRREFMSIPRDPSSMMVWSMSDTGAREPVAVQSCQFYSPKFNGWIQGDAF